MPIETHEVKGRKVAVTADRVPCRGGPCHAFRLHRPYDKTIPLSDGRYRLIEPANGDPYYQYEPEGRRRLGHGPDE